MNDFGIITVGVGIALSMLYGWRTGYASGGLISAGIIALSLHSPQKLLGCLVASLIIWPLLALCVNHSGLHGRARIGCAMLMALSLRLIISCFIRPVPWIGWVIPGLIAADIQKQGLCETLTALINVSVMTAFVSMLTFQIGSLLL